jgi:hypothetical protein
VRHRPPCPSCQRRVSEGVCPARAPASRCPKSPCSYDGSRARLVGSTRLAGMFRSHGAHGWLPAGRPIAKHVEVAVRDGQDYAHQQPRFVVAVTAGRTVLNDRRRRNERLTARWMACALKVPPAWVKRS